MQNNTTTKPLNQNKMKETAVEKLLEFFIKKEKEGCSHWCIHDLIAWLYISKEMEKEQIIDAWITTADYHSAEQYYNETFKSE